MNCPKCGAPVGPNDRFCRACGADLTKNRGNTDVPPIDPSIYGGMPYGGAYGPSQGFGAPNGGFSSRPPMKWYYFLIYFSLFAGAFLNVVNAFLIFTGSYYVDVETGNYTASLYAQYAGLNIVDFCYAVALLLYAGLMIYTRFALAKYRKHAPTCLLMTYVVQFAIYAVYTLICIFLMMDTADPNFLAESLFMVVLELAVSAVMILLNRIYFNKRKHLFVN